MKRLSYKEVSPASYRALLGLETYVQRSSLERPLVHLLYLRVSQLNGCAFCIDMHARDLRDEGETPERLALVQVFRESSMFSTRERAALAYAEALTVLGRDGVPDDVYHEALTAFGEVGLVELTVAIAMINGWNRVNIAFRVEPGSYRAGSA